MTTTKKINQLTDAQALRVVESLVAEFADAGTPDTRRDQVTLLAALFRREGLDLDLSQVETVDPAAAAATARQLLALMAQIPEIAPELDTRLDHPPVQEAAAVPLILAVPVVLTGCLVLLQVAGHLRFERKIDGSWSIGYDPARPAPLDQSMKQIVSTLGDLMKKLIPVA